MNDVRIASSQADARAAEAVEQHHAQMAGALALRTESLAAVARVGREIDEEVRMDLVAWCRSELVPHALAEESTLYRAAGSRSEGRLLVEAMLAEHQAIIGLVGDLERAPDAVTAAVSAGALHAVFGVHLAKENQQVLPMLVAAPDVSLADLLGGMHELLGEGGSPVVEPVAPVEGHACACGHDDDAMPELDARTIPHEIRHATIFGALDSLRPGDGLVLVAPHDPRPLLDQLEARAPGAFTVDYLDRGPDTWRLAFVRVG